MEYGWVIGIIITIACCVFGILVWSWHRKEDTYKRNNQELQEEVEELRSKEPVPNLEFIHNIKSLRIKSVCEQKYESLSAGVVDMTVQEISSLWSGMFA